MKGESAAVTSQAKRKPGRPRSMQSEEAIIKATTALLTDEGYASLTVGKVAARARASKSTIYRRWPTKEHLVIEAFNRWPARSLSDLGSPAAACAARPTHIGSLPRSFRLHSPRYARGTISAICSMGVALATAPLSPTGSLPPPVFVGGVLP
jgi:AcrR family transcriptional regulator